MPARYPTDTWSQVSEQAEKELGIPVRHLLLTATHTHSVPFGTVRDLAPRIAMAISQAAARLQPVRMAYGTGVSYINVNRNLIDPKTHRWWEGPNYAGVSDKTVAVIRFETLEGRTRRRVLQLRGARRAQRAAGSDQRRHPGRGVALHRGCSR